MLGNDKTIRSCVINIIASRSLRMNSDYVAVAFRSEEDTYFEKGTPPPRDLFHASPWISP